MSDQLDLLDLAPPPAIAPLVIPPRAEWHTARRKRWVGPHDPFRRWSTWRLSVLRKARLWPNVCFLAGGYIKTRRFWSPFDRVRHAEKCLREARNELRRYETQLPRGVVHLPWMRSRVTRCIAEVAAAKARRAEYAALFEGAREARAAA